MVCQMFCLVFCKVLFAWLKMVEDVCNDECALFCSCLEIPIFDADDGYGHLSILLLFKLVANELLPLVKCLSYCTC